MSAPDPRPHAGEKNLLALVFVAALLFHGWAVSRGWTSGFLTGNEYRQTQTAISALFIQREDNFSLAYPTPVLGKPWSVPHEFPLYQWSVVLLSNATGWPLIPCARAVSLACFYLALPALWVLLGRLGLGRSRRLLVLAAVLTSPLYIFYARAFLIETMALMFALWFLAAYGEALARRSGGWLLLASVAGVGAGLVKVTTFLLYLLPAAVGTVVWLWTARREPRELLVRAGWGLAAVAGPLVATIAWIRFADLVKEQNVDGRLFKSGLLTPYAFGTWANRLSLTEWTVHARTVITGVAGPVALIVLAAALVVWAGRARRPMAAGIAAFAAGPAIFPILYAWHEYYFVASAVFLLAALGWGLAALLDTRCPRWVTALVVAGTLGSQAWIHVSTYHPVQRVQGRGGTGLTALLRDTTGPDEVLVIAGQDWSSIVPFYAERRALMFRRQRDFDWNYVPAALDALEGEQVAALLLTGSSRSNTGFRDDVVARYGLGGEPVVTSGDTLVYVGPALRRRIIEQMHRVPYGEVELTPGAEVESAAVRAQEIGFADLSDRLRRVLAEFGPQPRRVSTDYPVDRTDLGGRMVLTAHPNCRLWFGVAPGRRVVEVDFGILPAAYEGVDIMQASDGVDFTVEVVTPGGAPRVVFQRRLVPHHVPGDRGTQRAQVEVELAKGDEVLLRTAPGPAGSLARDWAYWGGWRFK